LGWIAKNQDRLESNSKESDVTPEGSRRHAVLLPQNGQRGSLQPLMPMIERPFSHATGPAPSQVRLQPAEQLVQLPVVTAKAERTLE